MMFRVYSVLLIIPFHAVVISESRSWSNRETSQFKDNRGDDDVFSNRFDGRIYFPTSAPLGIERYTPPIRKLKCQNSTYCEEVPNYPRRLIDAALKINKDLKLLSDPLVVTPDDISNRMNGAAAESDTSLCESYQKIVYPRTAESANNEWFFVVNQDNFRQGIRVEICKNANSSCELFDGVFEGYRTMCKQQYVYRQLVALTSDGQMKPETFRFPSSCCCHAKFTGDYNVRLNLRKQHVSRMSET